MTGNAKTNLSVKKVLTRPTFADHATGNTGGQKVGAKARGLIGGQGWDENTQRTVNIIQDLKFDKGQAIDTVNLVGWSRGAVTRMRIANLMYGACFEAAFPRCTTPSSTAAVPDAVVQSPTTRQLRHCGQFDQAARGITCQ